MEVPCCLSLSESVIAFTREHVRHMCILVGAILVIITGLFNASKTVHANVVALDLRFIGIKAVQTELFRPIGGSCAGSNKNPYCLHSE